MRGVPLPTIPYVLPTPELLAKNGTSNPGRFGAECAGVMQPPNPSLSKLVTADMPTIDKEDLWKMPIHETFELLGANASYHTLAQYAAEHNFFHLFDAMTTADGAPLPHVAYADFMRICTFSSLQNPADEHFSLPAPLLRNLLTITAHALLKDPSYFFTAERLFRTIEQQQAAGSEVLSAWVMCCTFAGRSGPAMEVLRVMDRAGIPFDQTVFCSMMCPSARPGCKLSEERYAKAKVVHARLHSQLSGTSPKDALASGTALHAMFVSHSLLLKHAAKWEVLRGAHDAGIVPFARTLQFAAEVYRIERGMRCGPRTSEALAVMFAQAEMVDELLYTLYFMRWAESLPQFAGLPEANFSEESVESIVEAVTVVARRDIRAAATCRAAVEALQSTTVKGVESKLAGIIRRAPTNDDGAIEASSMAESLGRLRGIIAGIRRDKKLDGKVEESTPTPPLTLKEAALPSPITATSKVSATMKQEEANAARQKDRLSSAWMAL